MDVVFDIDGTLANAAHRLHLIKDHGAKDWETFLSDEMVVKDTPIPQTWRILTALLYDAHARIIFITGRPEKQRRTTWGWLIGKEACAACEHRALAYSYWWDKHANRPLLYMRKDGDRRPSHIVKEESLKRAIADGFKPTLVFEDRKDDTAMWRRNGLLCCQVAEGDY